MESKTLAAPAADPAGPARNGMFGWYADAKPRERSASRWWRWARARAGDASRQKSHAAKSASSGAPVS